MRRLLLILLLPLFAAPAFTQSATPTTTPNLTNPDKALCGLPKWGQIKKTVTYDLIDDCAQDYFLEIETAKIPDVPLTLTINGYGHTITYAKGTPDLFNFLVVDDEGISTPQNVDTPLSPHIKVIIRDVTFDAEDVEFRSMPRTTFGGPRGGLGPWILVDGELEMENVTFKRGNGIWVWAKGKTSLKNVVFEKTRVWSWGYGTGDKGALNVDTTAVVTLHDAVFRHIARSVVQVQKGGHLSTTGCLSFIRTFTHNVYHSKLWDGLGTWSDSSSGPCSGNKGNGAPVADTYSPELLDSGLPKSGIIGENAVYTLTQDWVCVDDLLLATGVRVTINGNGKRIYGCEEGASGNADPSDGFPKREGYLRVGGSASLHINNANIYGLRLYNYGGQLTMGNSLLTETSPTPIINYGWAHLYNSVFEHNQGYGDGDGKVYFSRALFRQGRAIFRDNVFRNNMPDDIEAYTKGDGTAIILCGENTIEGLTPQEAEEVEALLFVAEDGGVILGCSDNHPAPAPAPARADCPPGPVEQPAKKSLGAIGVILYVEKCPLVIEIWEVLPNSQGQFSLRVSQADIEAMKEGDIVCSANGRAAVRIGMTEPVRQIMAYSKTYVPPSQRGGRDILVSVGPNYEHKVHHLVIDHALDGTVMGAIDTRPDGPPCEGASVPSQIVAPAAPAPPPQPTPIPIAAPVTAQPAREDGSIVHVVQPGDTIWAIGVAYDVHPYKIIALNNLNDPSRMVVGFIHPGQELIIRPAP